MRTTVATYARSSAFTNTALYRRCRCRLISEDVTSPRWRLFGHVPMDAPAQQAIDYYFADTGIATFRGRPRTTLPTTSSEILSKKGNKNTSLTSLNVNGIEITNTLEIANMFNTFFTNIGNELANKINYSGTKYFMYYLRNGQNHKFTLNEVNEQTVTIIIENLTAKSSRGYDDI